jgi:CDP-diglyceride synthetase
VQLLLSEEALVTIFETLCLFLPAVIANMSPGFARALHLPGDVPISARWFGAHKTWRGHIASLVGGLATSFLLHLISIYGEVAILTIYQEGWLTLGILMGVGAKLGDTGKSFVKRRLGRPAGERWWPWDQIDYMLGAIICSFFVTGWISWWHYLVLIAIPLSLHGPLAKFAHRTGQKKTPW